MPHYYSRAYEKFSDAEYRLATGKGDVRSRIRSAYFVLNRLYENDLPPDLVEDWRWIMNQLTQYGKETGQDGYEWQTAIDHTMSRIRNSTGQRIAERIHAVYRELIFMRANNK